MIKSVIFDLGRVLLTFEPVEYLNKLYGNGEKARILYNAVFGSKTWLDLDRGTIDYEKAKRVMASEFANYAEDIDFLMDNWVEIMAPIEDNIAILKELRLKGFKLFLLSNFHREAYDRVSKKYDFFKLFDGIFISSHYGLLKPEREIFLTMLNKFLLAPSECIFIDDTQINVSAAEELGITGIVYTEPQRLRQKLEELKIL
ncbi:HAD-superfamily hydrolase, subfamily IA, variant 3 [Thermoclostridium stercorarium subsp. stercorarium DSM 8532]|jgi:epoxide hydrolase-like predicted phosphatase|uniref:HAD-superfamily hydrolase, subfamily IA, variant 3 n=2 Tax=Thermoclostridium stercorarium TaxID=1510 RepID=L7VSS6_THES1|nr:HAD family phosphatase [Thermoclostridium stercorarium]AGC69629.1 HAD-superfamily hydrolase, subfamily IA, variant 3 [Thermoclostridium stercorarium subsp. stercorarium DSM 8532]AGI40581.1 haloacid dehalogenase [Thermoclostridium stercorarium subsp. stercorarium DSM 8532]ANW99854.1 HAD family hydrolase [Thermoclostridium stercorarium subsp. thermolacticum DSM 2910]UZQ85565.1 HAD family phosphatase [Thermoclostridium stercorarium]